jgi:hypothetical protein
MIPQRAPARNSSRFAVSRKNFMGYKGGNQ